MATRGGIEEKAGENLTVYIIGRAESASGVETVRKDVGML